MKNSLEKVRKLGLKPVEPYTLALFRVIFGVFMVIDIVIYFRMDLVRNMFVLPSVNFTYDFFHWVKPLPEIWLNGLLGLLLVLAVCITLGVFFKWSCRLFAVGYFYVLLLDKSIYNNHIYLFILIAFLLSFTQADQYFSLRRGKAKVDFIPAWQPGVLKLQVVIAYFFAALPKLKYDWLIRQEPIRTLVDGLPDQVFFYDLLKNEAGIMALNYGGLALDLLAPLLLIKRWRNWIFVPLLIFHIMNAAMFDDIGIFPYVMFFAMILFFDIREIPWGIKAVRKVYPTALTQIGKWPARTSKNWPVVVRYILLPYIVFQVLFPLRGFLLPNRMDWTTIGNRFAWRVKADTRKIHELGFFVFDQDRQEYLPINIQTLVNTTQLTNLSMDPRSIIQFASFLEDYARQQGVNRPLVHGHVQLQYNKRQVQQFFSTEIDLGSADYHCFKKLDWVYPVADP